MTTNAENFCSDSDLTCDADSVASRFELASFLAASGKEADREQAKAIFLQIINEVPDSLGAWVNLGILLFETGYTSAACTAFSAAVSYHPQDATAHVYLGNVLLYRDDLPAAKKHFEIALQINHALAGAHRGLASIYKRQGDEESAALHRKLGYQGYALSTLSCYGHGKPIELLILASAQDGNIPWRLLIDRSVFHSTILAVEYFDGPLPDHQLVFNAIGDADLCRDALEKSVHLLKKSQAPVINFPEAVLQTGRVANAVRLAALPGVISPRMSLVVKTDFYAGKEILAQRPILLRSPGFHGGNYFVRVESENELQSAFKELPGDSLLAIEFLDSRSEYALFRKYRVMFINGALYPIHLAISARWNVHYFSSDMEENEQYRNEEAFFLNDFRACLGNAAISALKRISLTLDLDYCGIDFGIDVNGNILLYEANPTMIINPPTHEKHWDYKRAAIANALAATNRMFVERANRNRDWNTGVMPCEQHK